MFRKKIRSANKGQILKEKQRKIKRILRASIDLFTKKGFDETTIESITKKAKVAKGTFYSFFKKKEDVLLYFLDDEINKSREELDLTINAMDEFIEQLELLVSTYVKHIFKNKEFIRILFKERLLKWGTKGNINELRLMNSLIQLIDSAKQKNRLRQDIDTKKMAEIIFSINTMYMIFWLNGTIKSKRECVAQIKEAIRMLIDGAGTT
jgi:AcrR family transcriptional regulator